MKKACENAMKAEFPSLSQNESLARALISAFLMQLNPTVSELADIKCAVSDGGHAGGDSHITQVGTTIKGRTTQLCHIIRNNYRGQA